MHIPVVMLSARSGDDATVEGLEAGADDYLVKPFSARELIARVRANLELDRVRRLADELARSRALLDQAEALAHVGSWQINMRDNAVEGSAEFFRILGVAADHLDDGGLELAMQSVRPDDRAALIETLERSVTDKAPLEIEVHVVRPDGEERLVRARGVPQSAADGSPQFLRGSVQDITEQRRAEKAMTSAAVAREAAAREHAIAEELQRTLLPDPLFDIAHLDVATFYRAGVEGTQAGGDWYDVIELPGGRSALVLGDVMGRGVRAAAVMGQLRATVRAYSRLDVPPAELLTLLDESVRELNDHMIVTCVYAVHDPAGGTLTYSNAGHLPPLLLLPGEPARRLTAGGPPLGTAFPVTEAETVPLPAGALLTLYTDGLVEHRGSNIDDGIDQLARAIEACTVPIEAMPGALADALLPEAPDDDVALLIAQLAPAAQRRWRTAVSTTTEPAGKAVSSARRAAAAVLDEWGVSPETSWDLLLAASELVTNAIRHGRAPVQLRLRSTSEGIVLEVHDGSSVLPQRRDAAPDASSGRGLYLVEAVSASWGVRPTGNGKTIWCVIA